MSILTFAFWVTAGVLWLAVACIQRGGIGMVSVVIGAINITIGMMYFPQA
jgi:hypothetical protein